MSKQVALAAALRDGTGKGEARALRRDGRVPAIAYGVGIEPTALSVDALELYHALHTDAGANAIMRLEIDGDPHLAMAREIHRHPVRRNVLHVDFVAFDKNKPMTVDVPIIIEGHAPGVDEGGVIDQQLYAVSVEVLPLEVPDLVTLDVSDMQIGDVKRIADLTLPAGVTAISEAEETIVTCSVQALDVPEPTDGAPLEAVEGAEAAVEEGAEEPAEAAAE